MYGIPYDGMRTRRIAIGGILLSLGQPSIFATMSLAIDARSKVNRRVAGFFSAFPDRTVFGVFAAIFSASNHPTRQRSIVNRSSTMGVKPAKRTKKGEQRERVGIALAIHVLTLTFVVGFS